MTARYAPATFCARKSSFTLPRCARSSQQIAFLRPRLVAIKYHRAARHQLVQEIEVTVVAREDRGADFARLQIDQAVVQQLPLLAFAARELTQPVRLAGKHSGLAPDLGVGRKQPVPRNVAL